MYGTDKILLRQVFSFKLHSNLFKSGLLPQTQAEKKYWRWDLNKE